MAMDGGMRFVLGSLATAIVLFVSAAVGAIGSWGLGLGAVTMFAAAVLGAIVLEDRQRAVAPRSLDTA